MSPSPDNTGTESKQSTECALCGLPNPKKPPTTEWNGQTIGFCCSGCRQVFLILSESGMLEGDYKNSDIYQTSLKLGIIADPEKEKKPEIKTSLPSAEETTNQQELQLQIGGMWCSACSWLIEKVVSGQPGVTETNVLFAADTARIRYRPEMISAEQIKSQISRLGYSAKERAEMTEKTEQEKKGLLLRMGIAIFLVVNLMMLNSVIYVGYFQDISPQIEKLFILILWAFATPSVVWCAWPIHKKAWYSFRALAPTMELLLSIGILTAYIFSIFVLASGGTHVYFDTSASLVALVLLGKYIETAARQKAGDSLHRLYEMLPRKVRLKTNRGERFVSIDQLSLNDHFVVKPGEKIPADGVIVKGNTAVDESLLTGESRPVQKHPSMTVVGASLNINGLIEVRASNIKEDSALSQIIQLVENALFSKSDIQRLVDRIAKWFVPAVLGISLATLAFLLFSGHTIEQALIRAITVVVIACPCALGIATPLAVTAGIGYAAKKGILIRDGSVMQKISRMKTLFFDKTGTVTTGRFSVLEHLHPGNLPQNECLSLIAAVESESSHPIAAAIVTYTNEKQIEKLEASNVQSLEGLGMQGNVAEHQILIGNRQLIEQNGTEISPELDEHAVAAEESGYTSVFYSIPSEKSFGLLILGDQIKENTESVIQTLKKSKLECHLISGDSETTTASIAGQIGFDRYQAQQSPQDKIKSIQTVQKDGNCVGMVGDGINDAPSLAQADVGIAIGSGTELAIASSDIVLLNSNLDCVREAVSISERTVKTIKQNLIWAFCYNTVGIFLAIAGVLNPLIAATAMLFSSISVVLNSIRLHEGPGKVRTRIIEIFMPWIEPSAKKETKN